MSISFDRGEPLRDEQGLRREDRLGELFPGRPGHHAVHEPLGRVHQDAGGLAARAPEDPAARRIRRERGHARERKSPGVCPGRVSVHPAQPDRMAGENGIQCAVPRKLLAREEVLIPATPEDPRVRRGAADRLGHALRAVLRRVAGFKSYLAQGEAEAREVAVGVRERGYDRASVDVQHAGVRPDERSGLGLATRRHDAAAPDGDGMDAGASWVVGEDRRVPEDEVGGHGGHRRQRGSGGGQEDERGSAHGDGEPSAGGGRGRGSWAFRSGAGSWG